MLHYGRVFVHFMENKLLEITSAPYLVVHFTDAPYLVAVYFKENKNYWRLLVLHIWS